MKAFKIILVSLAGICLAGYFLKGMVSYLVLCLAFIILTQLINALKE